MTPDSGCGQVCACATASGCRLPPYIRHVSQMRSCHRFPHLVQLKNRVMPSSVLAEKKTASLCWHASHVTSRVLGSVGSARTSCRMTVFSLEV